MSNLDTIIRLGAYGMSITRKVYDLENYPEMFDFIFSSPEDMVRDWCNSCSLCGALVLNGFIKFCDLGSNCYPQLENICLKRCKETFAYFLFKDPTSTRDQVSDYYEACNELRKMLVHPGIKQSVSDFREAKNYLTKQYLDKQNKLDLTKDGVEKLLRMKAYQLYENTGNNNKIENMSIATKYAKMYYNNIIDAVENKDPDNIGTVLKAFQFSESPRTNYEIINCFEASLAIYFFDPSIVRTIWTRSNVTHTSNSPYSEETVNNWPDNFITPMSCKGYFEYIDDNKTLDKGYIKFTGFMNNDQKKELTKNIKRAHNKYTLRKMNSHLDAIDKLYKESHELLENMTF